MKLKILIVFLVLAAVGIGGVFYVKNYLFYANTAEKLPEKTITISQTLNLISENREKFQAYTGGTITADRLPLDPGGVQDTAQYDKVILHFWASWCNPCVNEIPELLTYLKKHEDEIKNNKLKVVLVSLDYELADVEKFLKSFPDLNFKLYLQLWDPDAFLQKSFDIDRLPSTFILHKDRPVEKFQTVVDWRLMD